MTNVPYIPETAPFTKEQRAWLNGFLAGLFAQVPTPENISLPQNNSQPEGEPLLVLFGSQSGTAEGLAKRFASEARKKGFSPQVAALNDFQKAGLENAAKAVIISSTWGDGDPPDNASAFWSWLSSDATARLEKLQYAVLGLGDRNYSEFCGAAKKFDARLKILGAKPLLEIGECDTDYEGTASNWFQSLWKALNPNSSANGGSNGKIRANGHEHPTEKSVAVNGNGARHALVTDVSATVVYSKVNPYPARLLKNVVLNRNGSLKEVRHYEFSLGESNLKYEAGDALGVLPMNCPELVSDMLRSLHCTGEETITLANEALSLGEALSRKLDISKPSFELLKFVAQGAPNSELPALLATERAADRKAWVYGRDILDLLALLPDPPAVDGLLPLLRPLTPRLYSIASSPSAHPGEVHLTVSAVRYETFGRRRKGVASTFLADRVGNEDCARVFVQPSHGFKLPSDVTKPVIMVGPGTGIAPFRAFLEERQAAGAIGKNWLFFGDQRRAADFLYEEQLTSWAKSGHLAQLDLAFSRDQAEKVYVQDRMREQAQGLWSWLEDGAHFYVCGDASRMAKDVDAALHEIIQSAGGKSAEETKAYVQNLKAQKRYQRDVY